MAGDNAEYQLINNRIEGVKVCRHCKNRAYMSKHTRQSCEFGQLFSAQLYLIHNGNQLSEADREERQRDIDQRLEQLEQEETD